MRLLVDPPPSGAMEFVTDLVRGVVGSIIVDERLTRTGTSRRGAHGPASESIRLPEAPTTMVGWRGAGWRTRVSGRAEGTALGSGMIVGGGTTVTSFDRRRSSRPTKMA